MPANICLFKVNNRNTRKSCETVINKKLKFFLLFKVNNKNTRTTLDMALVSLLLCAIIFHTFLYCLLLPWSMYFFARLLSKWLVKQYSIYYHFKLTRFCNQLQKSQKKCQLIKTNQNSSSVMFSFIPVLLTTYSSL